MCSSPRQRFGGSLERARRGVFVLIPSIKRHTTTSGQRHDGREQVELSPRAGVADPPIASARELHIPMALLAMPNPHSPLAINWTTTSSDHLSASKRFP